MKDFKTPYAHTVGSVLALLALVILALGIGAVNLIDEKTKNRFMKFAKSNPSTGCWDWQASKDKIGYGNFSVNGRTQRAHRISYLLFRGPIADEQDVCHRCDNRTCVNPDHLFLATHTENMRDMVSKGRSASGDRSGSRTHPEVRPRGESNSGAKLTNEQVLEIHQLLADRIPQKQIARRFNVSHWAINEISTGKTWSHLSEKRA